MQWRSDACAEDPKAQDRARNCAGYCVRQTGKRSVKARVLLGEPCGRNGRRLRRVRIDRGRCEDDDGCGED